jgi:glycerophosphoryl diester phosphodiesterase
MSPPLPMVFRTVPFAHRGLHDLAAGVVENTPAAFAAAIAAGYGIELDVQISADGQAMVFHDEVLDRLTAETGPINARSASKLNQIAVTGGNDTIPTLSAVLALVAGRVPLLIEIKDQTNAMSETDGRLEQATATALAGYGGPVAVMSFNPHAIARFAQYAPDIPRGLTTSAYLADDWVPLPAQTCAVLRDIPDYDRLGASFVSHEAEDLTRLRIAELRSYGATILCWTIKSAQAEANARKFAHNITFEGYHAALLT